MSTSRLVRVLAAASFLAVMPGSTAALAASPRSFVSATGNDANACSLTAPCRTFAAALAQTSASGEIIVLDSAGYGAVTIAQSVAINVPTGVYAGISVFSGAGITVNGPGIRVALRGLLINGQGGTAGIDFVQGAALTVEDCIVSNLSGPSGVGIRLGATGSRVQVRNTTVRGAGGAGIAVSGGAVMLDGVRLVDGAGVGLLLTGSGDAVATLTHGVVRGNGLAGIEIHASVAETLQFVLADSLVAGNGTDGVLATTGGGGGRVDLAVERSTLTRNGATGITVHGAGGVATGTVRQATITRNEGAAGLLVTADFGTATATLEASTITYNDTGVTVTGTGAAVETRGSSTIEHNVSGDVTGTTPAAIGGK